MSGDGNYVASTGTGGTFTPASPGHYNWIAVYSGDSPNTKNVSGVCGDANEGNVIISLQPTIATAQWVYPNDEATLNVLTGGGDLAGSVKFSLYNNSGCSGSVLSRGDAHHPGRCRSQRSPADDERRWRWDRRRCRREGQRQRN